MLTTLKRQWAPSLISQVPLGWWHRMAGIDLILPHWHIVSDEDVPHVSGLYQYRTVRQFRSDLEFFLANYTPVSLADIKLHLDGVRALPPKCFFPTFDDGFREIHDLIGPLLAAKGIPAGFFLITSAIDNRVLCYPQRKSLLIRAVRAQAGSPAEKEVERLLDGAGIPAGSVSSRIGSLFFAQRPLIEKLGAVLDCNFSDYVQSAQPYLTGSQVESLMKHGFAIGAHSVEHPRYSDLTIDEQVDQTRQSMQWLSSKFGYTCDSFALPYRDMNLPREFFPRAFQQCSLQVSFTLDRISRHFFPRNLVRFSMERSDLPAEQIVARQYALAVFNRKG